MTALFPVEDLAPEPAPSLITFDITAYGTPAGQGRVSFFKGRGVHSNADKLKPWRKAISEAAQEVAGTHPYTGPPKRKAKPGEKAEKVPPQPCKVCGILPSVHGLLTGPLGIEITVSVEQSTAAAKRGDVWPANRTSSDIDHHARSVLDALTTASLWRDDAQVVELCARKVWAGGLGIDALTEPGVVIHVWQLATAVAP
ncbi:RusA family crossover junction endodeoxyribonuclease [Actinacidiphila sp. DG2A-62]|uniref:RusA family crossover junction endodeoxyribonuclease n=1 Tax=Actinacidiphila sp. DG2A-62 TaxID=3108821 RepID=UPI002DBEB011|nr:RusA family crossover junction endodeoxyribonuclease [Actinacidiphila sp. DG2A-62]MEC3993972.1 RusA family crossover junction endodeoxyribonuclease [Actinacidiphila sp. DG2A-62]